MPQSGLALRASRRIRAGVVLLLAFTATCASLAQDDVLAKSEAMYLALKSYSDHGTIIVQYGVNSSDHHTFSTAFNRAPRQFLFDFRKQGGDRFVTWGDPDAFHTWYKTTDVQEDYPNPSNTGAFIMSGAQTAGSSEIVPSLLYAKGALPSVFTNFSDPKMDGTELLGGRKCYLLTGTAKDVYSSTGHEVNVRKLKVWIDAETLLIRKIVEDGEAPPGQMNRTTTIYEPQANVALDDSRFKFTKSTR